MHSKAPSYTIKNIVLPLRKQIWCSDTALDIPLYPLLFFPPSWAICAFIVYPENIVYSYVFWEGLTHIANSLIVYRRKEDSMELFNKYNVTRPWRNRSDGGTPCIFFPLLFSGHLGLLRKGAFSRTCKGTMLVQKYGNSRQHGWK